MTEVVCVFPFWSQSDAMNWDSNYQYLSRVLPVMEEMQPDWLWLVMWPQKGKGADNWKWHDDGLFTSSRIFRVPWPYDTAMRTGVIAFDPDRFAAIEKSLAPTIYWLHQVESGMFFKGGYRQSYNLSSKPVIVAQHHYIIHESLPYPIDGLFPRRWAQMGGTLAADHVVLNSAHTFQMMIESFSDFMHEEAMQKIIDKSEILPFGLVNQNLFEQSIREHDKPVVLYNHRFENYKQPKVTAEVLNALRRGGLDFDVWVTQYASQKVGEFPVDRIVGDPDFSKYIENIAVPAVNTINSVHETFCISILDSLALGQLVVAPNALTFPELVPDDYPFLFTDQTDQVEKLGHIIGTWPDEYHRWHQKLRDHAAKQFNIEKYCEAYLEILTEYGDQWKVSQRRPHVKRKMENFFNSLKPGEYPLHKFGNKMREKLNLQHQSCPNRRVIREATRAGAGVGWSGREVIIEWGL